MDSQAVVSKPKPKLVAAFAHKLGVDPNQMLSTLKATAFKQRNNQPISNEQMMALLVVADKYGLNPFVKEIYAFADRDGIVPVVGVDGWSNLINSHPEFDGMEFIYPDEEKWLPKGTLDPADALPSKQHVEAPPWIECVMYRKDRKHPIKAREHLREVYQAPRSNYTGPWQTHTSRMLRHKALIQCARMAFGFGGIHDEDEALRTFRAREQQSEVVIEAEAQDVTELLTRQGEQQMQGEEKADGPAEGRLMSDAASAAQAETLTEADVIVIPADPENPAPEPEFMGADMPPEARPAPETTSLGEPVERPETLESSPEPTVSNVVAQLAMARDRDQLDAAYDLVNSIEGISSTEKRTITSTYNMRKAELDGGDSDPATS